MEKLAVSPVVAVTVALVAMVLPELLHWSLQGLELQSPCHGPPSSDPRAGVGSASWAPDPSGCAGTEHPRSSGCAAPAPTRCGAMVTGISTSAWHWLTPSQHLIWHELIKEWLQANIPLPRSEWNNQSP